MTWRKTAKKKEKATRMKIFLPWPPSANKIWRNLRGSRGLYLAKEYKRFVDESKIWLWKQGSPRVLGDENLEVVIKLYPPTKRGYDVDNRIKPTLDALTKVGFWRDDKIARKVTAFRCQTDSRRRRGRRNLLLATPFNRHFSASYPLETTLLKSSIIFQNFFKRNRFSPLDERSPTREFATFRRGVRGLVK